MSHSTHLLTPSSPGVYHPSRNHWKLMPYLGEGCQASRQPCDASTLLSDVNKGSMLNSSQRPVTMWKFDKKSHTFTCDRTFLLKKNNSVTVRASSGAVYCNRTWVFAGLWLCLFVCGSVITIIRNCVHTSSSFFHILIFILCGSGSDTSPERISLWKLHSWKFCGSMLVPLASITDIPIFWLGPSYSRTGDNGPNAVTTILGFSKVHTGASWLLICS